MNIEDKKKMQHPALREAVEDAAITEAGREQMDAERWEYGAFRFLHSDGKWGTWLPYRSPNRETTKWAMNKLTKDKSVTGFERRDVTKQEAYDLAKAGPIVVMTSLQMTLDEKVRELAEKYGLPCDVEVKPHGSGTISYAKPTKEVSAALRDMYRYTMEEAAGIADREQVVDGGEHKWIVYNRAAKNIAIELRRLAERKES